MMVFAFPRPIHRRPVPQLMVVKVTLRKRTLMALVNISFTTQDLAVSPTTPGLDSFLFAVSQPGQPDVASVIVNDLNVRSGSLDVPPGAGYLARVALVSADGTVVGPGAVSSPFDVGAMLPVPVAVAVSM